MLNPVLAGFNGRAKLTRRHVLETRYLGQVLEDPAIDLLQAVGIEGASQGLESQFKYRASANRLSSGRVPLASSAQRAG